MLAFHQPNKLAGTPLDHIPRPQIGNWVTRRQLLGLTGLGDQLDGALIQETLGFAAAGGQSGANRRAMTK